MTIAVIGAMQTEIISLTHNLNAKKIDRIFDFSVYYSKIDTTDIYIVECGIGKVNASAVTQQVITQYKPTYIINTGIAGSMNNCNKIGDIIIGNEVTHHDVRQEQMKTCFPYQHSFYSSTFLLDQINKISKKDASLRIKVGKIVSGENFINNKKDKERILNIFSPDCVDMESSAIAHIAFINKTEFLIIRTICDNADETAIIDYEEFEKNAAEISSSFVLELIKLLNNKT